MKGLKTSDLWQLEGAPPAIRPFCGTSLWATTVFRLFLTLPLLEAALVTLNRLSTSEFVYSSHYFLFCSLFALCIGLSVYPADPITARFCSGVIPAAIISNPCSKNFRHWLIYSTLKWSIATDAAELNEWMCKCELMCWPWLLQRAVSTSLLSWS